MEVERGAHADEDGCGQANPMLGHPPLLLRRAQPDPHHVGVGCVDDPDHRFAFLRRQGPERRCVAADYLKAGKAGLQSLDQQLGHAGAAPVEEVAVPGRHRPLAERQQQIGAIDPLDERKAFEPAQPHQRHPVRSHHSGRVMDAAKPGVPLALHDSVDAADADVLAVPLPDPSLHRGHGLVRGERADSDAKDVYPRPPGGTRLGDCRALHLGQLRQRHVAIRA